MSSVLCLFVTFWRWVFLSSFCVCIDKRIGYHSQPDSHGKHERLSDSRVIKLLFWGVPFKVRPSSAAEMESLRLRSLFWSQRQFKKARCNEALQLTTTGGWGLTLPQWSHRRRGRRTICPRPNGSCEELFQRFGFDCIKSPLNPRLIQNVSFWLAFTLARGICLGGASHSSKVKVGLAAGVRRHGHRPPSEAEVRRSQSRSRHD